MAQGYPPSQQAMEVDLRRQLNDVFGEFDDFAGLVGVQKQVFGVVPTSGVMIGLTPYSVTRLPSNADIPPASLCLQEMKNVPPLLPPLHVNRNPNENSGCASEASSSQSHKNDDENYNGRRKKKKKEERDEEDGAPIRRTEDKQMMRDLFDDDDYDNNDEERGVWRGRGDNMPRQGIRLMIMNMQVEPLIPPIETDLIPMKKEQYQEEREEEMEEEERMKMKRREEMDRRRRDKNNKREEEEESRRRKDEEEEKRKKRDDDEKWRRNGDDERKKKRDNEERETERKRLEVVEKRKRMEESGREEEEERIRQENKRIEIEKEKEKEKEERRIREEEEKILKEAEKKKREEDAEKRRLEEEEYKQQKENREQEELARKYVEDKQKEVERMRREDEELRKRELDEKKEIDERKKKEGEDIIRKERKRKEEKEKRRQKDEVNDNKMKDDCQRGRKEKTGSLILDNLSRSKLEALKEKEKDRKRGENVLSDATDEKIVLSFPGNETKRKEEKRIAKKMRSSERTVMKEEDESWTRHSPMSSKNSSRVATPIPTLFQPSTSTHSHGGISSPSTDPAFSFPHCLSSCAAAKFIPTTPTKLEHRVDGEGYTNYAKEKKHRGDASSDRVIRFLHYMESSIYFALSVSTCHPSKSTDRELSMAGCVLKDTVDLIKHALVLIEKEGKTHLMSRAKILCIRSQSVLNYHMYFVRSNKFPRRAETLASLELQVQEVPRDSPKKEGSGGKKAGDTLSSNSSNMVTMPISLWKMKSSQVSTYSHLELSHNLWNDSVKLMTWSEKHYWNTIDNLILKSFEWGCPLHVGSSLVHLAHFINTAVSWMRSEYEAEQT